MVESLNVSVSVAVSVIHAREEAGRVGDGSAADAAALFVEYERRGKEHQFMKHNKLKQKAEDAAAEPGGGVGIEVKKDKETRRAEWLAGQKAAAEKRLAAADEDAGRVSLGFRHQPRQLH